MNFEKFILIIMGSVFSASFSVTAQAEKLQNMDAVWKSVGVVNKSHSKDKAPVARQVAQKKAAQLAAQKKIALQKLLAKKQVQQANKKKGQVTKLDRQRAAWKAKWDAQQKAKKVAAQLAQNRNTKNAKVRQLAKVKPRPAQKAPKPLTRAQYQWRFKQAQLKKQQQQKSRQQQAVRKNTAPKASYATFRQNNNSAIYNKLPAEIVSKLRATGVRESGVSAYVQDVNSPKPLLAYKDKTSRVPASVMKLITSYASLGILGPNYRWPVEVFSKGQIKSGTLHGDLIIKGYGSPEFKTADLRKILKGIRQKGIRNVKGRIVFDDSYFNAPKQSAGSFDGKSLSHYNAKPNALLFNERLSSFQVRAVGKRVRVTTSTPASNLKIVNKMRKTRRGCRTRMRVSNRGQQTVVTFTGKFSRRCGTRTYTKVVSKPANMIYGSMKAFWKKDVGGKFNARFAQGRVPAGARPLLTTYSRTLAQILPTIDKDSNNVMARQLLLTIGAKRSRGQGTERNGANAIGEWLASRGLHFPELRIENGSGLSRTARISARHVGDLLVDAYRSPFRNYLMQSLAIAGVDGTMKRRLKRTPVRGRGFFKTGTLRDVRAIAGYVKAADGKTYVMAILHNDPKARKRSLAAHDKLIEWVYDGGGRQRFAMR